MDQLVAIQIFVDVVELGSLSAAAKKRNMSRSMATRYIAALEKTFNSRLLHRSNRSLGLTSSGEDILPYCRKMVELSAEIESVISDKNSEPCGSLRVTASISFGQSYLAEALMRFMDHYPRVSIELLLTDRPVNLVEERIDLAIQVGELSEQGLISRLLTRCGSIVCAAPAYLSQHGTPQTPAQLIHHQCLVHSGYGHIWRFGPPDHAETDLTQEEILISSQFSTNDTMVLLNAALAGRGIAHLPAFSTHVHIDAGALIPLFTSYKLPQLGVYALYLSRKHLPMATRVLLDYLVADMG